MVFNRYFAVFSLSLALGAGLNADAQSRNLAEEGSHAEAQGYFNLAVHYYFHALKQNPKDPSLKAAYERALIKRREAKSQAPTKLPAPGPKSEIPIPRGQSVLVGDESRAAAKALNEYNLSAPRSQRIKYVFTKCGSLSASGGAFTLAWNADLALILADTLAGEGRVFAVVSAADLRGSESIPAASWDALAKELLTKLGTDDRINGLLFDLGPSHKGLLGFYASVKKAYAKPMGIAVSSWDKSIFCYSDFTLLYAEKGGTGARDQAKAFLEDARAENGKAIVSFDPDEALITAGRKLLGMALVDDDPAYLGICLNPAPLKDIKPAVWELLKLPLERP